MRITRSSSERFLVTARKADDGPTLVVSGRWPEACNEDEMFKG